MDIGKVSDRFGHFPKYRGVTGTPPGVNGPSWALVEERGGGQEEGRTPKPNPNWERGRSPFPSPTRRGKEREEEKKERRADPLPNSD